MSGKGARGDGSGVNRYFQFGDRPFLKGVGTTSPEAWFLGSKAENADEFERLIVEAIRDGCSSHTDIGITADGR
ncbi:hypothetical protein [Sorangium sp. So ce1151]|uniref:hypothetical protein n=1 Tax=Sorangium sp. So ce1151 TaxID=3133332 RepID=UPI003F63E82E